MFSPADFNTIDCFSSTFILSIRSFDNAKSKILFNKVVQQA